MLLGLDRGCPAVLDDIHPAPQEHLLQHLGEIGIVVGQQLVAGRDQCHPRAAAREEIGELAAGRPGTEHDQVLGQIAQLEHLTRGQHAAGVGMGELGDERRRAGAHEQRVELDLVVALVHLHGQRVGAGDPAATGQHPHVHAVHPLAHAAALVQRDRPRTGERAAQVHARQAVHEVEPVVDGAGDVRASHRPWSAGSWTGSRRSSCSCRRAGCLRSG